MHMSFLELERTKTLKLQWYMFHESWLSRYHENFMVLVTQTSDTRILLPFFAPNQPFYHRVNGCYLFARTIFFEVFFSAFLSNLITSPETTRWVYPLPTVLVIKPMMQVLARVFLFCFLYLVKSLRRTFSQVT